MNGSRTLTDHKFDEFYNTKSIGFVALNMELDYTVISLEIGKGMRFFYSRG